MPNGLLKEQMPASAGFAKSPDIRLVFPANEKAVRVALKSVRLSLCTLGVDDLTLDVVEIVLAEAANNIVEHAYVGLEVGAITLSCTNSSGELQFELIDTGTIFPGGELPPKQHHDLDAQLQSLPEGGFGWGLIRDMTYALTYQRRGNRNVLRFAIKPEV